MIGAFTALALVCAVPAGAWGATITVNSSGDSAANDGACTLREAITAANSNAASGAMANECAAGQAEPTADLIEFDIAGAGPHVIAPGSDLPDLTQLATVDGSTDGADEIALNGAPSAVSSGVRLGGGSTINHLSIYGFGTGVVIDEPDGTVQNSFIGTNEASAAGIGNSGGISMSSSDGLVRGNVISGNTSAGVQVFSSGNQVAANRIGTNASGVAALGNGSEGVRIAPSADSATIGGPALADANLISGNDEAGISASRTDSTDAITGLVIQNNRIGTGIAGQAAIANGGPGLFFSGNIAGAAIADNLISGNAEQGIELTINVVQPVGAAGPSGASITGNLIGSDADGVDPIGNGDNGISIQGSPDHPATGNTIGGVTGITAGGPCTGDCNLIAANSGDGIEVNDASTTGTEVLGNYIGTDVTGNAAMGNANDGVNLSNATDSQIGSAAGANVISANGLTGVSNSGTTGIAIQGNLIGVGADSTTALGNDALGVFFTGSDGNTVGGTGPGEGNVIGDNDIGVWIAFGSQDVSVLGNSITANEGLGIDLGDQGVTPNDPGDGDAGDNNLQNFPALTAVAAANSTVLTGTLDSTPATDFRIEVFSNAVGDSSGHGEAETFLGAFDVTTDGSGAAEFAEILEGTAGAGHEVSATVTELGPLGEPLSTSELAANVSEGTCDVEGTSGDDPALAGTPADEVVCGFGGDDVIDGGGGDDIVLGGTGEDELDLSAAPGAVELDLASGLGAAGGDTITVLEIENVIGSAFDDEIVGQGDDNVIEGGDGDDTLEGLEGADKLVGGDGKDTTEGGDGKDDLRGKDSKDTLKGGSGADELEGGEGGDTVKGGDGEDDLQGGDGDDTLDGGPKDDDCSGGSGKDTLKSC